MSNLRELFLAFQERWSIEKIRGMSLEEYTSTKTHSNNNRDDFTFWIENRLEKTGSIWGGSSFKFGIFRRNDNEIKENNNERVSYDKDYGWLLKYGNTAQEVFDKIKDLIIEIISASQSNNLEVIDKIDLGHSFKWKIAFHYQNIDDIKIVSIFNEKVLKNIASKELESPNLKTSEIYQKLLSNHTYTLETMREKIELPLWKKYKELKKEEKMQNRKFWLYKAGEGADKWEKMYSEGLMGIGWKKLGDLNRYKSLKEIEKKLNTHYPSKTQNRVNDRKANWEFCHDVSQGDIVIVGKGGDKFLGYGEVIGEYFYDETLDDEFSSFHKVKWIQKDEWTWQKRNQKDNGWAMKTFTNITKYPEELNILLNLIGFQQLKNSQITSSKKSIPLNQILYGPPGTGKTYDTIKKALEILGVDTESKNRQELKELFEDYKSKGQIEFVTFHQSFSYEEFIEGIKPVMSEENNMTYEVQNGIFREICKKALANYQESQESHQSSNFEELFQAYALTLKEKLDEGESIAFYQSMKICSINLEKSGKIYSIGIGANPQSLQNLSLKIFLRDYQDFKSGKIKNYKDIKPMYKSTSLWHGDAVYYFELYKKIKEFEEQEFQPTNQEKKKSELKPYILIIDEINRGNVSKIFGELITLIESSKRIGSDEELRVTLPYSSNSFGVPKNLYIIGTMNTADRSITTLDTALRRRFEFIEMMPDSQMLVNLKVDHEGEEINLKKLLEAINQRIEFLYDREKTIGHAFFLSEDKEREGKISLEQLKGIFQNKIIPLLQEYFYNDYEAIDAVLNGNEMIKSEQENNQYLQLTPFKNFIDEKGFEKKIFKITSKNDGVWDNPQTYIKIYSPTHSPQKQDNEDQQNQ